MPLELRRDEDLVAGGNRGIPGEPVPSAAPSVAKPAASEGRTAGGVGGSRPVLGVSDPVRPGDPRPVASAKPSFAEVLRDLDRRIADAGRRGLASGTGQQIGPFFFDPEGADFTAWLNHFKNEVYRNWIVPQPALLGMGGQVDLELTVEHDGRVSSVRLLQSAGNVALDRAARNALLGSRAWELPADFGPPRVVMRVSFLYNVRPQGS